jgi:hypothetical protein
MSVRPQRSCPAYPRAFRPCAQALGLAVVAYGSVGLALPRSRLANGPTLSRVGIVADIGIAAR